MITARYFSSCPSDSTSRWTPCPPEVYAPGRRRITAVFGYDAPHSSARGTSTLPNNALLSTHYAAADFCDAVGVNRFTLSHDSVTHHRPPEVSSTAFDAQPPDLPPAVLMEMGFAAFCPLAPCRRPHHPILVHRLASLLHASFTPRLAATPLRFAITSPPSGCEEDFHLQAVKHARHTKKPGPVWSGLQRCLPGVSASWNLSAGRRA